MNCLKNNIKIYIKTAPTCFGAVIPSSGSALLLLAKVTVVERANWNTSVCGVVAAATTPHTDVFQLTILTTVTLASTSSAFPDDGVAVPKHVGAVLMSILT